MDTMANDMLSFSYGKTQVLTSPRMQKRPGLAKIIYRVFGYTSVGNWARAKIFVRLLKYVPLKKFRNIMDLGAGLGEFTFMMADALPDAKITALEIMPDRVDLLNQVISKFNYRNVKVFSDKIESMPDDEAFDFIFSVDVFEHIIPEEMPFADCHKRLKPGGYLLVKMPNVKQQTIMPDSWFDAHNAWLEEAHVGQVYNLDDLVKRFKETGFTIVHASYSDGWISRVAWELGYFTAMGGAIPQLLFLPLCKFIYGIERLTFRSKKRGNAIQVIGRK